VGPRNQKLDGVKVGRIHSPPAMQPFVKILSSFIVIVVAAAAAVSWSLAFFSHI